jgi:hypothetical protein
MNDDPQLIQVIFLKSLTGELPEEYIREPELPEGGPDTPGSQSD